MVKLPENTEIVSDTPWFGLGLRAAFDEGHEVVDYVLRSIIDCEIARRATEEEEVYNEKED